MVSVVNPAPADSSLDSENSSSATFVSRVTSIPAVVEAYSAVNSAVTSLADKNKYAKYAVDTTSNAISTASKYAEPYQQKFAPQISKVDEMGTKVLDLVENKFPIITQPSSEVLSNARGAVEQVKTSVATSLPVTSASNAVKNLESALASVMDNVEGMVEKYLPEQSETATAATDSEVADVAPASNGQVYRAVHISVDVQKRLARKLLAQVKQLQGSIPEAKSELLKLKDSSNLMNAVSDSIRSLNEKIAPIVDNWRCNAASLKESGVERAKALDAQYEISERVDPIIKSYLAEIAALTEYVQVHVPGMKTADSENTEEAPVAHKETIQEIKIPDAVVQPKN